MKPQVIPEGAGPVKSGGRPFLLAFDPACGRADKAAGSGLGRSPTA